jgi:acetate kinase
VRVLVLNAGSSSLKHALVEMPSATVVAAGAERWEHDAVAERHAAAVSAVLRDAGARPDAVGHRVVHGGERFLAPTVVDDAVLEAIDGLAPLAPLHNPAAADGIRAARDRLPGVTQVACFDTAFHHTLPEEAKTLPLPERWRSRFGLRRYGFHGINVRWCAARAAEVAGGPGSRRLVVCHLGSGCSVTAVLDGRSVDTTMGFTPLDGVTMATRPGTLDPGVLLHLGRHGIGWPELEHGLTHESGIAGLSGGVADVATVMARAETGDEDARRALAVFVRSVAGAVAAMTTALGGIDCLVFSGGVGEHAASLRDAIVARLAHLGDVRVLVVPADEERMIATDVAELLGGAGAG